MTAGEIVLAYNLPGNPQSLKLPRDVYPAIFSGKITNWNDPKIVAANPDVKLPDLPITVVRRSDSSGTTFVFTQHLAAISPAFKETVGVGTTVQWPTSDKFVAAPKNDGVTATIKQTPGAIGYIEYGYAKLTKAPTATAAEQGRRPSSPPAARPARRRWPPPSSTPNLRRLGHGPGRRRRLPDRHLHLDAVLQGPGRQEGRGAARAWSSTA